MKKRIILSFLILLLTTIAWAQERVEAPVINVGSKWITKADNGWEITLELIGEEKDVYVFSRVVPEGRQKGERKSFYSKKNMNCVKVIRDGKEEKEVRDIAKKFYDFPLYPGKEWYYRYTVFSPGRDVDIISELSVTRVEDVEVPAGKFKAFKVKVKNRIIGIGREGDVSGAAYYWWAPDAKNIVKQEFEPGFSRGLEYTKIELVSFELK